MIADYFCAEPNEQHNVTLTKSQDLRYGENPHQQAAYYHCSTPPFNASTQTELLQGKPLSYNNLLDADAALLAIKELTNEPACAIIKHSTPCGVAQASDLQQAYLRALATDSTSAFGGIIAVNRELDAKACETMLGQQFIEVLLAPEYSGEALELLSAKPNLRVIRYQAARREADQKNDTQQHLLVRSLTTGILTQEPDHKLITRTDLQIVTERQPTDAEMADLLFAWKVVKTVKSNAIVYAKNNATLGIGGGQTSRVFSAKIGALKAEEAGLTLKGSVMASDAFFPFADGLEFAIKQGITAVIQPGGSKRDDEVIAAANNAGIAMVLTGFRCFNH